MNIFIAACIIDFHMGLSQNGSLFNYFMNYEMSIHISTEASGLIWIDLIISSILLNSIKLYSNCLYVNFAAITRKQRLWD